MLDDALLTKREVNMVGYCQDRMIQVLFSLNYSRVLNQTYLQFSANAVSRFFPKKIKIDNLMLLIFVKVKTLENCPRDLKTYITQWMVQITLQTLQPFTYNLR